MEIKSGAASAELLEPEEWADNDFYYDYADELADDLECDIDDIAFLDRLTNGGEKGAGLEVLRKAVAESKKLGLTLVLFAYSTRGNQDKLVNYYLSTGLFERIGNHTNWLVAKR